MDRYRTAANLSTLANGLVGAGAIAYVLAGNKLWAMLLIVCGIGFDGLDGLFSRRSPAGPSRFGRAADSFADAITFGVAPASLVAIHTDTASSWLPWSNACWVVAGLVAGLAVVRLVYFTARGYRRSDFLGSPTPQTALGIVLVGMLFDRPALLGVDPLIFLIVVTFLAVLMVAPIPFPKIRRGAPIRPVATVTSVALVVALLPLQFVPSVGSPVYWLAAAATGVSLVGTALYYVVGPFTVSTSVASAP
ncbi:MAG TPA: CDP-alcohol phosphatidyltransferase family protein [Thermoplasmata archaeon]|nr:CDP-alcohol phosphatidyltransferase family protein [Thermoplasmata archaeon]